MLRRPGQNRKVRWSGYPPFYTDCEMDAAKPQQACPQGPEFK